MSIADLKQRLRDIPGIETLTMQMLGGRQVYSFAGRIVGLDAGASDLEVQHAIRASVSSGAIAQIPAGVPVTSGEGAGQPPPGEGAAVGVPAAPSNISAPDNGAQTAGQSPAPAEAASPVSGTASATNNTAQSKGTATTEVTAPSPSAALIPQVHVTAPSPATVQPKTKTMTIPAPGGFAASLKAIVDEAKAGVVQAQATAVAQVREAAGRLNEAKEATLRVGGNMAEQIHGAADSVMAELGQISNDI